MKVIKYNGDSQEFDPRKIVISMCRAFFAGEEVPTAERLMCLSAAISTTIDIIRGMETEEVYIDIIRSVVEANICAAGEEAATNYLTKGTICPIDIPIELLQVEYSDSYCSAVVQLFYECYTLDRDLIEADANGDIYCNALHRVYSSKFIIDAVDYIGNNLHGLLSSIQEKLSSEPARNADYIIINNFDIALGSALRGSSTTAAFIKEQLKNFIKYANMINGHLLLIYNFTGEIDEAYQCITSILMDVVLDKADYLAISNVTLVMNSAALATKQVAADLLPEILAQDAPIIFAKGDPLIKMPSKFEAIYVNTAVLVFGASSKHEFLSRFSLVIEKACRATSQLIHARGILAARQNIADRATISLSCLARYLWSAPWLQCVGLQGKLQDAVSLCYNECIDTANTIIARYFQDSEKIQLVSTLPDSIAAIFQSRDSLLDLSKMLKLPTRYAGYGEDKLHTVVTKVHELQQNGLLTVLDLRANGARNASVVLRDALCNDIDVFTIHTNKYCVTLPKVLSQSCLSWLNHETATPELHAEYLQITEEQHQVLGALNGLILVVTASSANSTYAEQLLSSYPYTRIIAEIDPEIIRMLNISTVPTLLHVADNIVAKYSGLEQINAYIMKGRC